MKLELTTESRAAISELLSIFNLSVDERTREIIKLRVKLLASKLPDRRPWCLTDASIVRILSAPEFSDGSQK